MLVFPHPARPVDGRLRRSIELQPFDAQLLVDDDIVSGYARDAAIAQTLITSRLSVEDSILEAIALVEGTEQAEQRADDVERLHTLLEKRRSVDIGQAADGVTILLGPTWRTDNMRREPEDRTR
jgi:hypothetical protein